MAAQRTTTPRKGHRQGDVAGQNDAEPRHRRDYRGAILYSLSKHERGLTVRGLEDEVARISKKVGLTVSEARFDYDLEVLMMERLVELQANRRLTLTRAGSALIDQFDSD